LAGLAELAATSRHGLWRIALTPRPDHCPRGPSSGGHLLSFAPRGPIWASAKTILASGLPTALGAKASARGTADQIPFSSSACYISILPARCASAAQLLLPVFNPARPAASRRCRQPRNLFRPVRPSPADFICSTRNRLFRAALQPSTRRVPTSTNRCHSLTCRRGLAHGRTLVIYLQAPL